MQLDNITPLAARVQVGPTAGREGRVAYVTAKATFHVDEEGRVWLDRDDPYPLFDEDHETPLGLLPDDTMHAMAPGCSVVLLGCARSPAPVSDMTVALHIGTQRQTLRVFGDRAWYADKPGAWTQPKPFTCMPLTFARAFGGGCDVLIDQDSPLSLRSEINPHGRGFHVAKVARTFDALLDCPPGYPAYEYLRLLPNLEDPKALIRDPEDAPLPVCWATLPRTVPLHGHRLVEAVYAEAQVAERQGAERQAAASPSAAQASLPEGQVPTTDKAAAAEEGDAEVMQARAIEAAACRAHPDWILPSYPMGAPVTIEGMHAKGTMQWRLPTMQVCVDHLLGDVRGSTLLRPCFVAILPEEQRFYVVYEASITFCLDAHEERSARMRLVEERNDAIC